MEEVNNELVLTKEERAMCEYVAGGGGVQSQRARAILALAGGASLAETAVQTGLTENQVKLWRGRFRNSRLAIFPEEVAVAATAADVATAPEKPAKIAPKKKDKKEKKEKKKGKQDKDKKGKKKGEKDKKNGKGKGQGKAKKKAK